MAAKSKLLFNYVAHIQREGKVTELAGAREDYSMKQVYQYLLSVANSMGGWLLAESITPANGEVESRCTYNEKEAEPEAEVTEDEGHALGASGVWLSYDRRYAGASRLTFRTENNE
jgi:hypothetical protein